MKKTICAVLAGVMLILVGSLPVLAHGHLSGSMWIGPGWGQWWGPVYTYPYYASTPVVVQQPPAEYIQPSTQSEEPNYWYFCENPQGYYPYVKKCPNGWLKVVPSPPSTDGEE
jgi:hypothetical protein